jgi:hypothetical protein
MLLDRLDGNKVESRRAACNDRLPCSSNNLPISHIYRAVLALPMEVLRLRGVLGVE